MSWERGRTDIERLIADGELERVTPSDEVAARLLPDADAHIALASKGVDDDPASALQLSYDAARKASAALLAVHEDVARGAQPGGWGPGRHGAGGGEASRRRDDDRYLG